MTTIYLHKSPPSHSILPPIDKMNLSIGLLLFLLHQVSTTTDPGFCLCALKRILHDYSLLTTDRTPPRYRSPIANDIGFFVVPSDWKPVNNASWAELGAMINAPKGMYSHISLDGIHAINNGMTLDGRRSAHLADIISEYQLMQEQVDRYHQAIIEDRTQTCLEETQVSVGGVDTKEQWQKFFLPRKT